MSSSVVEAFAVFTAALGELRKSFDELYQVYAPDLVELIREHIEDLPLRKLSALPAAGRSINGEPLPY